MKKVTLQIVKLFTGLFLYAIGIVMTINANLGLGPWDVFHQGLSMNLNIRMGQASIGVGIIVVLLNCILGERIGWGTLGNMLFIGMFMDLLMVNNLIPVFQNVLLRGSMMIMGMFVIGCASSVYLSTGLGSGPRDGLMIALTKKTGKSVSFIRNSIEISALVVGYILGGTIGVGTLLIALGIGHIVQYVFRLLKFDVSKIKHRFIDEDIRYIKDLIVKFHKDKLAEQNKDTNANTKIS